MIFKSFLSQEMLGLDVQPTGIYAVRLKRFGRRFQVNAYYHKDLPGTIFREGVIQDWQLLQHSLHEFVQEYQLVDLPVIMGLAEHLVMRQELQLSKNLNPDDIQKEVRDVFKSQTLLVDYLVAIEREWLNVTAVAVQKAYVEQLVAVMSAVKLQVKIIDLDNAALERMMLKLHLPKAVSIDNIAISARDLFAYFYFACDWQSLTNVAPYLRAFGFALRELPAW